MEFKLKSRIGSMLKVLLTVALLRFDAFVLRLEP